MGWLSENWGNIYVGGALLVWALSGIVAFFGIWLYAAERYQLAGMVLGWIPGGIAAATAALLLGLLWPLALVALVLWLGR